MIPCSRTHPIMFWHYRFIRRLMCCILYVLYFDYFCLPTLSGHGASFSSKRTRFQMPRRDAPRGLANRLIVSHMLGTAKWFELGLHLCPVLYVLFGYVWILSCRAPKLLRLCLKRVFAEIISNYAKSVWSSKKSRPEGISICVCVCFVLFVCLCGFLCLGIGGPASTVGSPTGCFWIGARGSPCAGRRIQWVHAKIYNESESTDSLHLNPPKFPKLVLTRKCPNIFARLACHFNDWVRTCQNMSEHILEQIDAPLDRGQRTDPIESNWHLLVTLSIAEIPIGCTSITLHDVSKRPVF